MLVAFLKMDLLVAKVAAVGTLDLMMGFLTPLDLVAIGPVASSWIKLWSLNHFFNFKVHRMLLRISTYWEPYRKNY